MSARVVALTGAGISAPSGLPVYRNPGESRWSNQDLAKLLRANNYGNNLPRVWQWALDLRAQALAAGPNAAHRALAEAGVPVVTQNVDGLHQRAGSEQVVELHGSVHWARTRKGHEFELTDEIVEAFLVSGEDSPRHPEYSHLWTRPSVVLFGEKLTRRRWSPAIELARKSSVLIVVGTSGTVFPAADLPEEARAHGARTILVALEDWTSGHRFDEVHLGDAAELLPGILAGLV